MQAPAKEIEMLPASSTELVSLPAKKDHLWKPGQSGNPRGRSKDSYRVSDLARTYTKEAIDTLVTIMRDDEAGGNVRVAAAEALLDRGWGKPAVHLEAVSVTGDIKDWDNRLRAIVEEMTPKIEEATRLEKEKHERAMGNV